MHEMNNPRLTLEDQLLVRRPSPLHDASPQTLYLEKTLESQLDEIRLLEAAALTHEQTVEAIFSQNQTYVDEITIEHEDEVQELKGRISDLEALVGKQGAKISEQGAKISEQGAKISEQGAKISEQGAIIEILLAEHTKRQRLLPSEESAAPGVGAT
jgi:predicted  nucleic acid-binding Zn-ribbon protein